MNQFTEVQFTTLFRLSPYRPFLKGLPIPSEAFGTSERTQEFLMMAETLGITQDDLLKVRSIFINGDLDHSGHVNISRQY